MLFFKCTYAKPNLHTILHNIAFHFYQEILGLQSISQDQTMSATHAGWIPQYN